MASSVGVCEDDARARRVELEDYESDSMSDKQAHRRAQTVAAGALLVASTLLFVVSSTDGGSLRDVDALLSAAGVGGPRQHSLMARAALKVDNMLQGANPGMALEAHDAQPQSASSVHPVQPLGSIVAASLKGERAKLRAEMLAKFNTAAEIPPPSAVMPAPAHVEQLSQVEAPASAPVLHAAAPAPEYKAAPSEPAPSGPAAAAPQTVVQLPQAVVQQMEAQIAQLQAKVQSLETHPTSAAAAPVSSAVGALARASGRKAIAQQRLATKASASSPEVGSNTFAAPGPVSVQERAAAAVDKLISARTGSAPTASERAKAMINNLIAHRLTLKEGGAPASAARSKGAVSSTATLAPSPPPASATTPGAAHNGAGGFSIQGAYGPATATPAVSTKALETADSAVIRRASVAPAVGPAAAAAAPNDAGMEQAQNTQPHSGMRQAQYAQPYSEYPQQQPVVYASLGQEGVPSAAGGDVMYFPGEQEHARAEAAMTPEALSQPNLPATVVEQAPQLAAASNPYDPTPQARPPLPDPMPTGYGAVSTEGVQDHLFDIFSSKKNAEQYLSGAGSDGSGAGGALTAPVGVAMAAGGGGGEGGDDSGGDPFDDAMFNVIHDCSLGGPGCR